MPNRDVKVSAIQMICEVGNKESNIIKALRLIDEASAEGSKIILLQECFSTEFICFLRQDPNVFSYAEPIPGPTTKRIAEKAEQQGIYIIAPIFERASSEIYYNSAVVINPCGKLVGLYRKTHIPGGKFGASSSKTTFTTHEKYYFKPGSQFPIFKTEFGVFGILICYDRQFPECWRILTLKGAEMIFVPVSAPSHLQRVWELVPKTRAFENGVFAILANRVGREETVEYFGESMIVNPLGQVLNRARKKEDTIVSATINLEEVETARMLMPMLRDRRPEIYGAIIRS